MCSDPSIILLFPFLSFYHLFFVLNVLWIVIPWLIQFSKQFLSILCLSFKFMLVLFTGVLNFYVIKNFFSVLFLVLCLVRFPSVSQNFEILFYIFS